MYFLPMLNKNISCYFTLKVLCFQALHFIILSINIGSKCKFCHIKRLLVNKLVINEKSVAHATLNIK